MTSTPAAYIYRHLRMCLPDERVRLLDYACLTAHVRMIETIYQCGLVSRDDVRASDALANACLSDDPNTLRALCRLFDLNAEDARCFNAVLRVIDKIHIEVFKTLHLALHFTPSHIDTLLSELNTMNNWSPSHSRADIINIVESW